MELKKAIAALATVAAAAQGGAARAEGLSLATGFDYTSGKYTGTEETQILYVPVVSRPARWPWSPPCSRSSRWAY